MDEIPDVVSARRFKEFNVQQKEELFETLLNLSEAIKDIPKKSLRKTLDVTFAVLQYKGEQVNELQTQLKFEQEQSPDEPQSARLLHENEKLKEMLSNLEDEKVELKQKIKDLTEELLQQQKRLQDALNTAEMSDKDSSDPLSELDKQEELLRNISRKNKHIKRLIKEIEVLQNQNIEQSKAIIQLEKELQLKIAAIEDLKSDVSKLDGERKTLKNTVNELSTEIARLEGNITYLEEERENSERDLKDFIERLEVKAQSWKTLLEQKEKELSKIRKKLKTCDEASTDLQTTEYTENAVENDNARDFTKMMHTLELRDRQIEQLELKLKNMAEEMLRTTQLMNKLSNDRENEKNPKKPRACCKLIEQSLQAANKRCREMSEMLERSEEDNALKSKQALQALSALEAYQRGEDGLDKAIRKCSTLEQKILSREKQIRSLVMQLNSMHEIANENCILRKRLNIPDDAVISTKNLAAKERSKEKMIDRLTLKLRASEEMRLQLKLEKTELRKQILEMHQKLKNQNESQLMTDCTDGTFNINSVSEIGEVPDSIKAEDTNPVAVTKDQGLCVRCQSILKDFQTEKYAELTDKPIITEVQAKYQEVLEENEVLRFGMHEILQRLREYDASSEHITIDSQILYRLLEALQMSTSAPQTPKKHSNTNENANAQKNVLPESGNVASTDSTETDELTSIGSVRGENISGNFGSCIDFKSIRSVQPSTTVDMRLLQQQIEEFSVYKQRYDEVRLQLNESDVNAWSSKLNEKITQLELELKKLNSSYNFMREDYDNALMKLQQKELAHIQSITELKSVLHIKDLEIDQLKQDYERKQSIQTYSVEEYEGLLKSHTTLQAQIAFIVENILSGSLIPELKINEICADYGIIEDNLQLNFASAEDFQNWKQQVNTAEQKQIELQRKIGQLEGLLEIAQDQIQSQQRLLNEITDNHIDLRHLVADLQSKTEEKHLLAKMQRELSSVNAKLSSVEAENDVLNRECNNLKIDLSTERQKIVQIENDFRKDRNAKEIKIKFLLISLHSLKEKYAKFTPLIFLTNFVFAYTCFSKKIKEFSYPDLDAILSVKLQETMQKCQLKETPMLNDESSTILIKLVKAETKCKLLEENVTSLNNKCEQMQQQLIEQRIRYATETDHWQTIKIICTNQEQTKKSERKDIAINTDVVPIAAERKLTSSKASLIDKCLSPIITSPFNLSTVSTQTNEIEILIEPEKDPEPEAKAKAAKNRVLVKKKNSTVEATMQTVNATVETQAVQTSTNAKKDVSIMVALNSDEKEKKLSKIEEELLIAQKCIEDLQQQLKNAKSKITDQSKESNDTSQECGIIEKTIMSLNALLMDKDKSISKYQDLLQNEREHNVALCGKLNTEIENLRSTVTNLNFNIKAKDIEIFELKTKMETISVRRNSNEKLDLAINTEENIDNSLNELTDEKIEELFQQDTTVNQNNLNKNSGVNETTTTGAATSASSAAIKSNDQKRNLEEKLKYTERSVKIKEEEITLLKEKLKLCQEREKTLDHTQNSEIEKLRTLIEEKDKQINELMDTLKSFHEDQQNFMKDTSSYSEDQISKLSADLLRTEATNKIYHTQIEALRRQLTNLQQREKQAREQNQSLRNQLIKRPVVSIKTELNTRVKTENMQKRIQQLEVELEEARTQIQRQQVIIEAKRAKSASEVGLWEKQKRWQQNAEKLKTKLQETECTLEKTRSLLQSARNTIARLEKDKQILESKLGRGNHNHNHNHAVSSSSSASQQNVKCCRTPSCPNMNRSRSNVASSSLSGKYTPSESPETCTGASSDYSSPSQSVCDGGGIRLDNPHGNLIEALKARIEMQQRKIIAMELEGKGTNALTCEMEKLQEKVSALEADNIRLEAKHLQLQLDNDLLRQNDATDRLQKRIKHLEDYIIALKEELAQTEANRIVCKCSGLKISATQQQGHAAEQTILSLRNLVEKLRAENKYLKDSRRSNDTRMNLLETMPTDVNRLQQLYADSLEKINALKAEINSKQNPKCLRCSNCGKPTNETPGSEELKFIKEQLAKKTQLLQKAKVLLTRAAAKEKVLKEQLMHWKRKCSELQNVPVIEEISE